METQRQQLVRFLKSRRASVTPAELGLPDAARRRTPGLRREDVAAVAGVSVTWYTWLEQGRDIKVSDRVLENISAALRLTSEDRDFLFQLAQHRPPAPSPVDADAVEPSQALQRLIQTIGIPAVVITEKWDVVSWNNLVSMIFRDYEKLSVSSRNLLKILLIDEKDRLDEESFEAMAQRVVPKFRVDYSQSAEPAAFEPLIEELRSDSPIFDRLWQSPELASASVGIHTLNHPTLGSLTFEHSSYVPEGSPHLRVILYSPHDADCARRVLSARAASGI